MFAIGETKNKVVFSKLYLPKEYHLKKKKLYGVWVNERCLYLSDEVEALKTKQKNENFIFEPILDSHGRIEVPFQFNEKNATIKGCISRIEIVFDS